MSMLILFLFLFLFGRPLQKTLELRHFISHRDEIRQDFPTVNSLRMTESDFRLTSHFQDFVHDIFSRSTVLPPGEWTRTVCRSSVYQSL